MHTIQTYVLLLTYLYVVLYGCLSTYTTYELRTITDTPLRTTVWVSNYVNYIRIKMFSLQKSKLLIYTISLIVLITADSKHVRQKRDYHDNTTMYNFPSNNSIHTSSITFVYVPVFGTNFIENLGLQSRNTQEHGIVPLPKPEPTDITRIGTKSFGQFFIHSSNSQLDLVKRISSSASVNWPMASGIIGASGNMLFNSHMKTNDYTVTWTNFFSSYSDYEWDVTKSRQMNDFLTTLKSTMTTEDFVNRYGRYVPNGYSKGCTIYHQVTVICNTIAESKKIESIVKISLSNVIYSADFTSNLGAEINKKSSTCQIRGSTEVIGPTTLAIQNIISNTTELEKLVNQLQELPKSCAKYSLQEQQTVRVRYMPWKYVPNLPEKFKSDVDKVDPLNTAVQTGFLQLKALIQGTEQFQDNIFYNTFKKLRFYNRYDDSTDNQFKLIAEPAQKQYNELWKKFTNQPVTTEQVTKVYETLYKAYEQYIRPLSYEISVVYNDKQNVEKLTEIPLKSNNYFEGTKLNIGEGTLQTLNGWIYYIDFWKPPYCNKPNICDEYRATIDFSTPSLPTFIWEKRKQKSGTGHVRVKIDIPQGGIKYPDSNVQLHPNIYCFGNDNVCFLRSDYDIFSVSIRIRPV